jgi:hypothetical protein
LHEEERKPNGGRPVITAKLRAEGARPDRSAISAQCPVCAKWSALSCDAATRPWLAVSSKPFSCDLARNASRDWNSVPILVKEMRWGFATSKEFHFHV